MCLGHLSLSPSLKIPLVPPIHTTPNLPTYLFIYLFITHWVHLVSPIQTWAWGHPLEQGQPMDGCAPIEKQLSPRYNNHWLTTAPHLRVEHKEPPPHPSWKFSWSCTGNYIFSESRWSKAMLYPEDSITQQFSPTLSSLILSSYPLFLIFPVLPEPYKQEVGVGVCTPLELIITLYSLNDDLCL